MHAPNKEGRGMTWNDFTSRSFDIEILKPINFNGMEMSKEWKRGDCQKKLWNGVHQEDENEVDLNLPGRKGLEDWWEKMD